MEHRFEVDSELKNEYLSNKAKNTARTEYYVLKSADEYESLIDKPLYYMSYRELRDLLISQFKNSSAQAISKNTSILRKYIDFCIEKNVVEFVENRLMIFSLDKIKDLVNHRIIRDRFISYEKLREYQNQLYNPQDQLLLQLPFVGIKGRELSEIINLRWSDVDTNKNLVYVGENKEQKRVVEVDEFTIQLIYDVYNEEFYYENNGMETNNSKIQKIRKTKVNKFEDYILRTPGKNKFKLMSLYLLRIRMNKIKDFVGNEQINFSSLYYSGMINSAKEIYNENGELTKEDYIDICNQFAYYSEEDKIPYYYKVKDLIEDFYLNV